MTDDEFDNIAFRKGDKIEVRHYFKTEIEDVECERLQTLPDGYTEGVSKCARYKALGNGWTVDVIAHIFSSIPQ